MKLTIIRFSIFFSALTMCIVSCNRDDDFGNNVYITQSVSSKFVLAKINEGAGDLLLSISAARVVAENEQVQLSVLDANYLTQFNADHQTSYSLLSDSAYTLSTTSAKIASGSALSEQVTISIDVNKWKSYRPGRLYAIPIKINRVGNGIAPIPGEDVALIQLQAVIGQNAAQLTKAAGKSWVDGFVLDEKILTDPTTNAGYNNFTVEGRFMCAGIFDGNGAGNMWQNVLFSYSGAYFHFGSGGALAPTSGPVAPLIKKLVLNKWYHFALVHKAGTLTYYIDGSPMVTVAYTPKITNADFGHTSGTAKLTFAEYRIWKTARSASQLKNFVCAADPTDADLVAYWPLNTADPVNVLKDISGNGNDLKFYSPFGINLVQSKCPSE